MFGFVVEIENYFNLFHLKVSGRGKSRDRKNSP
jgi:hypothetical protein